MKRNISLLTLYVLCLFFAHINMVNALSYEEFNTADNIELIDHRLWVQADSLHAPPSFPELSHLYQNGKSMKSTFTGSDAYVTKLKLSNKEESTTWFVNINAVYLDIGTAYWQSDNGDITTLEAFGQITGSAPKLAHSQVFSLPLKEKESGTLWVYVQAKVFTTPLRIRFYSQDEFYFKQFTANSLNSISFTVMITLALIAFLTYIRTKYLVTLACTGYIGLHGLGWLAASGSLSYFNHLANVNLVYSGILLFPFAIVSASQFTKLLFNCEYDHPKLSKIFNLLSIISLILGVLMLFLPFTISYFISHSIAIVWIPLCIGTGILMQSKKDYKAKYYLLGNLLYGLALALYVLTNFYKVDWDIPRELIVEVALTIDCMCILLCLTEWMLIQQKEFNRSYTISRIDPLTNIGNRFALNETLANLSDQYCITFIDLDNFKQINDQFGHDEGDKFLIDTANLMATNLKGVGSVFRCGGDEFIWVVTIESKQQPETLLTQLSTILLKTEQELRKVGWKNAGLSFGIATSFETLNQSECLSLADQRMYQYKQARK